MAQLPTSFNAPHSNISDGSDLIRAAMGLNRDINEFGNKAFSTISDFAKQQANQALVNTFANNIANGMDPTSAMSGALGKVNSWTSAEAINNLLAQRNFEQESLRKEALLDIQKAQENRALQDWTGKNEASEANLLLETGYNTNNSNLYNQGLSKASDLSDVAKKFIKMQNLAEQQDRFASSAVSRGYTKALTDQIADKKLVAQLDARFRVLESQNPTATKTQIAQAVAQEYNLSPDQVNLLLNEHGYASGQSLLKEASSSLSNVLAPETVDTYNKAQANLQNLNVDSQKALEGNTEQNKKDKETIINALSADLTSSMNQNAELVLAGAKTSPLIGGFIDVIERTLNWANKEGYLKPSNKFMIQKDKAQQLISNLVNNPTTKNFETVKNELKGTLYSDNYIDWLNSNFIVENGKVKLSPNSTNNLNTLLNQELVGDRTRGDVLAESQVDLERAKLGINKAALGSEYAKLLDLTRQNSSSLTPEQRQNIAKLAQTLNNLNIKIGNQTGRVADAVSTQNPTQQINQTYNTFRDIVESNKVITTKQLVDKGLTESQANAVIERIRDVTDEAKDSKEYRGLPANVIAYAVLDDFINADSSWYKFNPSDKSYLKRAVNILDKVKALQKQSSLVDMAQAMSRANAQIQSNNYLNKGYNY